MINERVLKKLFLICICMALIYPAFNLFVTFPTFKKLIIKNTEEDAIKLAFYLEQHLKIQNDTIVTNDALVYKMQNIITKLNLYNIKIFKSNGLVVYSKDDSDIGIINDKSYFHKIVKKGFPYSKLVKKNSNNAHGKLIGIDIIETYVPVKIDNKFIGAFEIYYIVTEKLKRLNSTVYLFFLSPILLVLVYVVTLLITFKRIEHDIETKNTILSKLKKSEFELKKSIETKNKLFSIISHDLRSPFTAVLGISDLLVSQTKNCCNEELPELSNTLNDAAIKLKNIIDNLFQWARVQIKNINYNPINFDLRIIINDTIKILESSAILKNIKIETNLPNNESLIINADEQMCSTIIRNLLNNALKYTPINGTIKITVESSEKSYHISIQDTGNGIEKEKIIILQNENIVESTHGTEGEKGSGLGLSICKNFIETHKGKFWIESEKGKGSTFHFSLPKNS